MRKTEEVDPELAALEPWFNDMHLSVFETMVNAQAVTSEASSNGGKVVDQQESFRALQYAFHNVVESGEFESHVLTPLVARTLRYENRTAVSALHLAQIWTAGTCTLIFFRMLDAIPSHLLNDESVAGELREKSKLHMRQWQRLLKDVK